MADAALLENEVPRRDDRFGVGSRCATGAGAAAWSSSRTRTTARSISPISAAGCSTAQTCRCRDYENRTARVDDCVRLTPENLGSLNWLPPTCAYRLLGNGGDLYWWHPLVSGDPETRARGRYLGARPRRRRTRTRSRRRNSLTTSWLGRGSGQRGRSRRCGPRPGTQGPPPSGNSHALRSAKRFVGPTVFQEPLKGCRVGCAGRRPPCPPSPTPP